MTYNGYTKSDLMEMADKWPSKTYRKLLKAGKLKAAAFVKRYYQL